MTNNAHNRTWVYCLTTIFMEIFSISFIVVFIQFLTQSIQLLTKFKVLRDIIDQTHIINIKLAGLRNRTLQRLLKSLVVRGVGIPNHWTMIVYGVSNILKFGVVNIDKVGAIIGIIRDGKTYDFDSVIGVFIGIINVSSSFVNNINFQQNNPSNESDKAYPV